MLDVTNHQITRSRRLAAVADVRRRRTLRLLQDAGESLSLSDLAIELVRRETTRETVGAECDRVQELQAALYHSSVPTLADADLVEFDADRRVVTLTEAGAEMISFLDRMPRPPE